MRYGAIIDSVGDESRFLTLTDLERRLKALPRPPAEKGKIALVVRKRPGGVRGTPGPTALTREAGVPGDAWGGNPGRGPAAQLAVMQRDVAELIASGQPLSLFGDDLFFDLDLSREDLPPRSRVRAGEAILEVTAAPHNGCRRFRSHFGDAALRFVSRQDLRPRNLRGTQMRVGWKQVRLALGTRSKSSCAGPESGPRNAPTADEWFSVRRFERPRLVRRGGGHGPSPLWPLARILAFRERVRPRSHVPHLRTPL